MGSNDEDDNLTKAVPVNLGETGMISLAADPETGEFVAIDAAKLAQLPSGGAYLVVRRGALEGMQFALAGSQKVSIGRSSDSGIFLDDVTVSRKHAIVEYVGNSWTLTDAGSLNGTYVNKNRVSTATLSDGDEVQIGKFRFVFVLAIPAGE
jgi:deferrochelatase/peroxidase EfeB